MSRIIQTLQGFIQRMLGTNFDKSTDSLPALRENQETIKGAGFSSSTDTLEAIRNAIDSISANSFMV